MKKKFQKGWTSCSRLPVGTCSFLSSLLETLKILKGPTSSLTPSLCVSQQYLQYQETLPGNQVGCLHSPAFPCCQFSSLNPSPIADFLLGLVFPLYLYPSGLHWTWWQTQLSPSCRPSQPSPSSPFPLFLVLSNQRHFLPGIPSGHNCQGLRSSSYQATHSHHSPLRSREGKRDQGMKYQPNKD